MMMMYYVICGKKLILTKLTGDGYNHSHEQHMYICSVVSHAKIREQRTILLKTQNNKQLSRFNSKQHENKRLFFYVGDVFNNKHI
mmetsp:Transcript_7290/g.10433  ORF Transcript_7290/g.10433 Transcript_7290/m.10433 type:complete len:85 (-) Transcript_7290:202-456(-)